AVTVSSDGCTDVAGNSAPAKTSAAFKIDKTAPVLADLGPTTSPNGAPRHQADVTTRSAASDTRAGLAASCIAAYPDNGAGHILPAPTPRAAGLAVTVSSDGCTDVAGNSAPAKTSAAFKIDKTAPVLADL